MNIADWQNLPPRVQEIFQKYRIISVQEQMKGGQSVRTHGYTTANLKSRDSEGRVLGDGPLISQDVLRRFLEADSLGGDYLWLDWILFHCGGGVEAQRRSTQSQQTTMDRFIDERVRGYRDTSGKYHPAVSKAEAEAKWVHSRDKFSDVLMVGDQDIVERLHVFGFYRNWPGLNKGYEDATSAVKEFLELLPKTHEMNLFMVKNAKDKVIKLRPSDYPTVESLQQATKKIRRFFASKAAREDIRLQSVYEDDFVQISCPLTYAAAVRYGWDGWPFAKVETFEENLEGNGNKWSDAWRKSTKEDENVIVYIQFHVPMPSWVSYDKAKFRRFTLQNLALFVKRKHLRSVDPWSVSLLDEEGRTALNLQAVKEMVLKEPKRIYDPAEEEYPLHVGPPVYESEAQAVEVVEHLATGIVALEKWLSKFDPKVITSDYMPEA